MTDLEKQTKILEDQIKNLRRAPTEKERVADNLVSSLTKVIFMRREAEHKYLNSIQRFNRLETNIHAAIKIIHGSKGYFRCSQHLENLPTSGVSKIEEYTHLIGDIFVEISMDWLTPFVGTCIYEVDTKGVMHFIERNADSSD